MEKYIHYSALDLAQEASFVRWAKDSSVDSDPSWNEFVSMYPDMTKIVEEAKELVLGIQFTSEKVSHEKAQKIWTDIETKIDIAKAPKSSRRGVLRMIAFASAAAIALIFVYTKGMKNFDTVIQTPYASNEEIKLPDGSKVYVNAGSTLKFDQASWEETRMLNLEGEAFFEVEKGSKFTVNTALGRVSVLGTSFNVYARNSIFHVECKTGKVLVENKVKDVLLTPNQSVSIERGKQSLKRELLSEINRSNWRAGTFVFEDSPLKEVLQELERQFDVAIKSNDSTKGIRFKGSFSNKSLETALSEVLWPLKLDYSTKGKEIIIEVK